MKIYSNVGKSFKLFLLFVFLLSGCAIEDPILDATATLPSTRTPRPSATPTITHTPTITATPLPTETPTITPTPEPMEPAQIFNTISPSIAFIETSVGSGSGILIEENYILTNAHVVWPFETARVVFPDGEEFLDTEVVNIDLMADLAILGPIDTDLPSLPLVDGESLVIGSNVYLIGYPGEVEAFPQPTITQGLISRLREWETLNITYFQSDASIAGGQSGGALVSERGEIIGVSGFFFTEAGFALVASATDIEDRAVGLINGEDVSGLGNWRLPIDEPGRRADNVIINNYWDTAVYILNEPAQTEVTIEVDSVMDISLFVSNIFGEQIIFSDEFVDGVESGKATLFLDAPYFVQIEKYDFITENIRLDSSHPLIPYREINDDKKVEIGGTINSVIDYPGDFDRFPIFLNKGQTINLQLESILIDPLVSIVPDRSFRDEEYIFDDDSGGGLFGLDAEFSFEAPESGRYNILVWDALGEQFGGYTLRINELYDGAPTPIAPPPTPTPSTTDFGLMTTFEDPYGAFSFQYPSEWDAIDVNAVSVDDTCFQALGCFEDGDDIFLVIYDSDLSDFNNNISLEELVDELIPILSDDVVSVVSTEIREIDRNLDIGVIYLTDSEFDASLIVSVYLGDEFFILSLYFIENSIYEEISPTLEFSINSFRLE